jgi:two-component system, chemotaxis family, response regulator Rcp1
MTYGDSSIEILLVEDNPGDVELTRIAFREARVSNPLRVVTDGVQAMAYLRQERPFERAIRPGLILLDLNLPRMDGREVLQTVKSDPELRRIPVCVISSSHQDCDVSKSYDLHANSYISKPMTIAELIETVAQLRDYWLCTVLLPSVPRKRVGAMMNDR